MMHKNLILSALAGALMMTAVSNRLPLEVSTFHVRNGPGMAFLVASTGGKLSAASRFTRKFVRAVMGFATWHIAT
jgi:hypothetical protein